jgi:hypothetical protein
MPLRPKNAVFHAAFDCLPCVSFPSRRLASGDPAAELGGERLGEGPEDDDWDDSEADEPPRELPWEAWDPLDDEPDEPDPRDFWPDLPDDDD